MKSYFSTHSTDVWAIMRGSGLSPSQTRCLAGYLSTVERNNGIQFVVKLLKSRIMSLITGTWATEFKTRKGHWVGPFRPVSKLACKGRRGLRKAGVLLRLHGIFKAKAASLQDYQKAYRDLTSAKDIKREIPAIYPETFMRKFKRETPNFDTEYPSGGKRAPMGKKSMPEIWAAPIDHIRSTVHFPLLICQHYNYFKALIGEGMPALADYELLVVLRRRMFSRRKKTPKLLLPFINRADVMGNVVILNKDPSLKHRLIANANRIIQLACSPIHNYTMAFLREHPNSWVYDQEEGVDWIQSKMNLGWKFSSIDLKSASDNIPLSLQVRFLKKANPLLSESLDIFFKVSRGVYKTPHSDVFITWSCGSPMGVKGSFGLFTVFLISIFEELGARGKFAIVGDDMVLETSYTNVFLKFLKIYHIPISKQKSLIDHDRFAEFCGKIIDAHGVLLFKKSSNFDVHTNPIGLTRLFGRRILRFIPPGKLSRSRMLSLSKFYNLVEEGVLETFDLLKNHEEKVSPPMKIGGLSRYQLQKVLPSFEIEDNYLLSLPVSSLSDDDIASVEQRRYELSQQALEWLGEHPEFNVRSWKILINHPAEAKLASFFLNANKLNAFGGFAAEAREVKQKFGGSLFPGASDVLYYDEQAHKDTFVKDISPFEDESRQLRTWRHLRSVITSARYSVLNSMNGYKYFIKAQVDSISTSTFYKRLVKLKVK